MINTDAVSACFGRVSSILSREDCDFLTSKVEAYPRRIQHLHELRFAHIDLAFSKDSAGVTIGHVPGFKAMNRGDYVEMMPIIQLDLILEVMPRGGEIEFENIRRLLYALRDKLRIPIKWVSFDQFQSKDSMQIMFNNGFMTGYRSMDVDTFAYDVTKQAFYDDRILAPEHARAQREMISLEIDTKKNKIDHPPNGSKDVADSIAGVVAGLTMRREIWNRHGISTAKIPQTIRDARGQTKNSIEAKEKALPMDRVRLRFPSDTAIASFLSTMSAVGISLVTQGWDIVAPDTELTEIAAEEAGAWRIDDDETDGSGPSRTGADRGRDGRPAADALPHAGAGEAGGHGGARGRAAPPERGFRRTPIAARYARCRADREAR
jgi:hypothetical protein